MIMTLFLSSTNDDDTLLLCCCCLPLKRYQVYSEQLLAGFFRQILAGVHYLHDSGVVHRDLKIDNILTVGSGTSIDVKIADFGLSALVRVVSVRTALALALALA